MTEQLVVFVNSDFGLRQMFFCGIANELCFMFRTWIKMWIFKMLSILFVEYICYEHM